MSLNVTCIDMSMLCWCATGTCSRRHVFVDPLKSCFATLVVAAGHYASRSRTPCLQSFFASLHLFDTVTTSPHPDETTQLVIEPSKMPTLRHLCRTLCKERLVQPKTDDWSNGMGGNAYFPHCFGCVSNNSLHMPRFVA